MRVSVLSALLVLLAGCASQPSTQDSTASGAAPVPPPPPPVAEIASATDTATQPAAAPEAAGGKDAAATASNETVVKKKVPSGYKRVKRNGREVYCRSVVTLGSRFAEEMCFTREQLEEIQRRTDSAIGGMEQGMKVCVPGDTSNCGTR